VCLFRRTVGGTPEAQVGQHNMLLPTSGTDVVPRFNSFLMVLSAEPEVRPWASDVRA